MHTQTPIMNQYTNSLPLNQMILTLVQRYNNIQLYKFSKQSNKIDSHEEGISDNVDYLDWTESAFGVGVSQIVLHLWIFFCLLE